MPHSKQARKRMRQNEEQRVRNKGVRTRMKSAIKKVLAAQGPEQAKPLVADAMKRIDKAAKARVIHKNTAARYKSRVSRAVSAG
jgi:small subunit ribosomal protein S20